MNVELRKKVKNDFKKYFFNLMNSVIFRKTMKKVKTQRCIQFIRNKARKSSLVSEPNYHTTKFFSENKLVIETKKLRYSRIIVCLGLSIL